MTTQGKRLKKIRQDLAMSQEQMGKHFDLSKQYWSNFENDRDVLNNEKLVKLIQYFKVNINYILMGIGEPFIVTKEESDKIYDSMLPKGEYYVDDNGFLKKRI